MEEMITDRFLRRALIAIALAGLALGILAWIAGRDTLAGWIWAAGTVPVLIGLAISMVRDVMAGRMGVDAIAFVSMSAALLLGENLAGAVVAVMYAGGNVLEDFAVARAERDLKSLVDRAPRVAHRRAGALVEDVPIDQVAIGDLILVRAGEVVPVDGVVSDASATLDEAALTGEPIPVTRNQGDLVHSGTINAGETFSLRATATAGESTYAGIVRMVTAAQTAKAPFIRLADRYALLLLPATLLLAAASWLLAGDPIRGETPRAVQALRTAGVARIVMITGDRADAAETIGAALDLDAVLANRVPSDKVEAVAVEQKLNPTLMVGDGINDAPALAAADVGIAMGARGASASSEAADVVILVDRLDRVSDAVSIARRARGIAVQSIGVGMALSGIAMFGAAFGWLTPVAGALTQEAIDVAVILNALRALKPGWSVGRETMQPAAARALHQDHQDLEATLDRLREIADELDDARPDEAVTLVQEANKIVEKAIVEHERSDESIVYPRLSKFLRDGHGLAAMSRAHREILHLARLLARLSDGLKTEDVDRYLIRDAQHVVESIEALVRIHNAQEEDIYEHAVSG